MEDHDMTHPSITRERVLEELRAIADATPAGLLTDPRAIRAIKQQAGPGGSVVTVVELHDQHRARRLLERAGR
jgi:hypothetical protein